MCKTTRRRLALIVVLAVLCGCGRKPKADVAQNQGSADTRTGIDRRAGDTGQAAAHERAGYIGSESCATCHEEIAAGYATHSMGRSATELGGNDSNGLLAQLEGKLGDSKFVADGYRYEVRKDGDQWIHHQRRIASDGSEMASVEFVAKHLIGSGNHGQSFLVERNGHLFMSPITWYPDKQIWDLSPGYERNNSQFNRPVIELCLYCHTDIASAVPSTLNRYETPAIHSHAIGCERCHGPGEQHVSLHQDTLASDDRANEDTIVNPAKLTADLREAVCQQCHAVH